MPDTPFRRIPREALPPNMQAAWQRSMEIRGEADFIEAAGNAPELFDWYADFYQRVFYGGRVPVRLKELARIKLSTVHGCAYCNRGNRVDALAAGLTEAELGSLDDPDAAVFAPVERAVVRLAERIAIGSASGEVDPALYAELRAHLDDAQIFELGITLAVLTGMARFLFAFDLVSRESWCSFGPRPAS